MFGGFAPLPLRLGGTADVGWTSAQHARVAADTVASARSVPLATLTVQMGGAAVTSYSGRNGVGSGNAPEVESVSTGLVRVTWQTVYTTEYFDKWQPVDETWVIRTAIVCAHWNGAPVIASIVADPDNGRILQSPTIHVETRRWDGVAWVLSDETFSMRAFGNWGSVARIGDYDGAPDKIDSPTEGSSSYFYDWFVEMQAMRGSAYSTSTGNVDAENFAMARQFGALNRAAEKFEANSLPGTSDEKLENWATTLAVPARPADQRWQLRHRCATKFRAAAAEASSTEIDAAVEELLGDFFVAVHRTIGADLDNPPPGTRWPVINPGLESYSLGGGAWMSERSFLWVEVVQPPSTSATDFFRLMDVDLFELLDTRLPAHMTFNWATSDGFLVGISQLGFAAL